MVFIRTPLRLLAAALPSLFPLRLVPLDPVRMATDLVLFNTIIVVCERLQLSPGRG
eukprot:gene55581-59727_t